VTAPARDEETRGCGSVCEVHEVALVDLLDRLLAGGVVLTGDVTISLAGVDLVRVSLRALVTSIREDSAPAWGKQGAT
jgi:hypothetical protein